MVVTVKGTVLKIYEEEVRREDKLIKVVRALIFDGEDVIRVSRLPSVSYFKVGDVVEFEVSLFSEAKIYFAFSSK